MDAGALRDAVVAALDDLKARDLRVLDVRGLTDITDYMVVASGTSDRHVKALADHVQEALGARGVKPLGVEGEEAGEWVLLDYGDVVAHVMRPAVREFYDLEKLWDEDLRLLARARSEGGD